MTRPRTDPWPPSGFGARLRLLRERAGIMQMELAERAGTSQATVCRVEAGRHEPAWPLALALADALGVSLDELRANGDGRPRKAAPKGKG